jgi:hypothetical protein
LEVGIDINQIDSNIIVYIEIHDKKFGKKYS